ncbi:hypothetical protein [Oceanicoccus sagamiensis]|uniref:DUF5666 domain-containing protein n=1 Tax=Oceanicoccus sagamiensis TaxID=716816 RepID=A0A1X9N936_9GAMM|nr:hypothetical protein [Oceanicoccus sagamiensis]ARN72952.1 hypothetical protein BST96_01820 [Oceanicoccus sagamiensis]
MTFFKQLSLMTLVVASFTAQANEVGVNQEKPAIAASVSMEVTAVVEAINHETREVSLKRTDGKIISFTAGDEARNLDQVAVGDIVNAEYIESVSIQVMAADNPEAAELALAAGARSEAGEMPGMATIATQISVATVEAINIEANTFKLKTADGVVKEYTARNPENLKHSAVGDIVVTTVTQGLAIAVEKAPAAE